MEILQKFLIFCGTFMYCVTCMIDCLVVFGSDFSLSQWLREKSLAAGSVLQPYHVSELFEKLSVIAYKRTPSCTRSGSGYATPDSQGWVNGEQQDSKCIAS